MAESSPGSAHAHALARAIGSSGSLLEWTLDDCDIEGATQAAALASGLACSTSIREFHLRVATGVEAGRGESSRRATLHFVRAAEKSQSLLHMGVWPEMGLSSEDAQARLAENRRRLMAGLTD